MPTTLLPDSHATQLPNELPCLLPEQIKIIRRPEVLDRFGISNTYLHKRIKQGLMPPPISLGSRSKGYLQHELDAVLAAMVAGKSEEHIKALVGHLVDQRKRAVYWGISHVK